MTKSSVTVQITCELHAGEVEKTKLSMSAGCGCWRLQAMLGHHALCMACLTICGAPASLASCIKFLHGALPGDNKFCSEQRPANTLPATALIWFMTPSVVP